MVLGRRRSATRLQSRTGQASSGASATAAALASSANATAMMVVGTPRPAAPTGRGGAGRELPRQLAAGDRRLHRRAAAVRIDGQSREPLQVEQQPTVAERRTAPAVPAAADRDLCSVGSAKLDARAHVVLICDAHD